MEPETERILNTAESGSAVLARGLALLNVIYAVGEISVKDLANRSGIPLATTYRLVRQLVAAGFAIENEGHIHAGPQIAPSPAPGSAHLVNFARPFLRELSGETGLSAVLTVRVHTLALCLDVVAPGSARSASFRVGETRALYAGASATPLLAFAPAHIQSQVMGTGLKRYTGRTPDEATLPLKLNAIRARGYDVSFGELQPLWGAVGVPAFEENDALCCISVTGPSKGLPSTERLVNLLTVAATRLSRSIPKDVRTELWHSDDRDHREDTSPS